MVDAEMAEVPRLRQQLEVARIDAEAWQRELAALRAECDALRAALRFHVIRESFGEREFRCVNCGGAWDGAAEQHSATCLAAPRKEGERG